MSPLWSYALAIIGLVGIYLTGKDRALGWAINFSAQGLWIVYAVITDQPGFIMSAVAYGAIFWFNWRKWKGQGR